MRGFHFGHGRQPLSGERQKDRAPLESVLQCILADFGMVEPPAAGCAPRAGHAPRDATEQVVHEVMRALEERGLI
jgi:hypothetical protein